jgi:hypothetical protein
MIFCCTMRGDVREGPLEVMDLRIARYGWAEWK